MMKRNFATKPSSAFRKTFPQQSNQTHAYGADWPTISALVKKRDNYTCKECGAVYKSAFSHLLQVHHINRYAQYKSHDPRFLITLCKDCHFDEHGRDFGKRISPKQKMAAAKFK